MGTAFWIKRFLFAFTIAFVIIAGAQLLKGHPLIYAVREGLCWAAISASIFSGARFNQSRKGQHCALCRDTPEMANTPADSRQNQHAK